MPWSSLANNEVPNHEEVVQAVAAGDLQWISSNPGFTNSYVYTRADYETYIVHKTITGIGTNEVMTKGEMLNFAGGVRGFNVFQDFSTCPSTSVRITWTGGGSITVEYRQTGRPSWSTLATYSSPTTVFWSQGTWDFRATNDGGVTWTTKVGVMVGPCPL